MNAAKEEGTAQEFSDVSLGDCMFSTERIDSLQCVFP
jgi:hypothetical protein